MIEAVCEELEVGAVIYNGGKRIFVITAINYDYNIDVVMGSLCCR